MRTSAPRPSSPAFPFNPFIIWNLHSRYGLRAESDPKLPSPYPNSRLKLRNRCPRPSDGFNYSFGHWLKHHRTANRWMENFTDEKKDWGERVWDKKVGPVTITILCESKAQLWVYLGITKSNQKLWKLMYSLSYLIENVKVKRCFGALNLITQKYWRFLRVQELLGPK